MEKCKTKAILSGRKTYSLIFQNIQLYSDMYRHIQTYLGIIQSDSGIVRTHIQNTGIFRNLAYLEA